MSPDVIYKLYKESSQIPYFWVDDVAVSGLLAKRIGVSHVDFGSKLAIEREDVEGWLEEKKLSMPPLFGHPDSDIETIKSLWNKTVMYYRNIPKTNSFLKWL